MRERFIRAARGKRTDRPPVWMMRQAGRYLPEYREIRSEYTFVEAISTPEIATEITLQPWERFKPDGVVMYSDILTALEPLGITYHIESGVGPVIDDPITAPAAIPASHEPIENELDYVGALLRSLSDILGNQAAVLGFVGGPFTIAAYAVEGSPTRSFMGLRRFRTAHPDAFETLLHRIGDVLVEFVRYQERHGADAIQLFDTYAGLLDKTSYEEYLLPVQRRILDATDCPTIMFARNMGGRLDLLDASGADVVGLDWTVEMASAREILGDTPVQGNLDPAVLYGDTATIQKETAAIIDAAGDHGHILNLGHGIDKNTPIDGVETFFETAKSVER